MLSTLPVAFLIGGYLATHLYRPLGEISLGGDLLRRGFARELANLEGTFPSVGRRLFEGGPCRVPTLRDAIGGLRAEDRADAVSSIARGRACESVGLAVLLAALRDPALAVRVKAVEQLESLPSHEQMLEDGRFSVAAVLQLASRLCAADPALRGRPFRFLDLPWTAPSHAHGFEIDLLTSNDSAIRGAAISAIIEGGPVAPALMPALRMVALGDQDADVRRRAMRMVLQSDGQGSVGWRSAMVLLALRDSDEEIVSAAVQSGIVQRERSPVLCGAVLGVIRHTEQPQATQDALFNLLAAIDEHGALLLPAVQESLALPSARTIRVLGAMERWLEYHPLTLPPAKARDLLTRVCSAAFRNELGHCSANGPVGRLLSALAARLQHHGSYQAVVLGTLAHRFGGERQPLNPTQKEVYQILMQQFLVGGEARRGRLDLSFRVIQRFVEVPDPDMRARLARIFFQADPVGYLLPPLLLDYAIKRPARRNLVHGALEVLSAYCLPEYSSAYLDVIGARLASELPEVRRRVSKDSPERALIDRMLRRFPPSRLPSKRVRDAGRTGT